MRLAERVPAWRGVAALLAGLVWPLAFAPVGWWPVAPASLLALFLLLDGAAARAAAARAFLFGLGLFGAGVWWVFVSVNHFGGLHWSLSVSLTIVLVVVLASFPALFGVIAARWLPAAGAARWLLGLPAAWVAVEWLRSWFLSGFPWLVGGYAFSDTVLAAWAPVGGVLTVSLAAALTAGAVAWMSRARTRRAGGAGLALLALLWGGAATLDRVPWATPAGAPLSVALMQGNVGQDRKWDPSQLGPTITLYHGLTEENWDADLIVWPEAALPALHHQLVPYLDELKAAAASHGSAVVMGILVEDREAERFYNAVLALESGDLYYKRHLVPFGEFFPVPAFIRDWLRLLSLPYSDFTAGPRDQSSLRAAGQPLGASICYEVAYGGELIRALPEAALLVNVSNDAWFGATIAPHQHLQIARLRAREASRWMMRATNTGITAIVGPDGRIAARLPQFEVGALRGEVTPMAGATPYARFGNWPIVSLMFLMLGVSARLRYA